MSFPTNPSKPLTAYFSPLRQLLKGLPSRDRPPHHLPNHQLPSAARRANPARILLHCSTAPEASPERSACSPGTRCHRWAQRRLQHRASLFSWHACPKYHAPRLDRAHLPARLTLTRQPASRSVHHNQLTTPAVPQPRAPPPPRRLNQPPAAAQPFGGPWSALSGTGRRMDTSCWTLVLEWHESVLAAILACQVDEAAARVDGEAGGSG
jgi:hypothetical protein